MAVRSDFTLVQDTDPRYVEIAAPSTEIVMQDYVDTLRTLEDDFQNMGYPALIDATGKQSLGGGVLVAVTVEEKNLQLAFEARYTPAETGTVTTGSGTPNLLGRYTFVDTSADFIAAGVQPGSYLINWTDRSVTDVVRVISATEIETKVLQNGTDNEWDIGDDYSLWNITQVRTSGGNLVAVDENNNELPAILPTWGTQVILTTSSSATIQELTEIRYAAYQNAVWVDATTSNTGTAYPNGTPLQPLNNVNDAVSVAQALGFREIIIIGNYTFTTGDDVTGLKITGTDIDQSLFTLESAAVLNQAQFNNASITGVLDGGCVLSDCEIIPPLSFVEGTVRRCLIEAGTITLSGSEDVHILDSWSGVAGLATPIINYGGSGRNLVIRNWSGGIEIQNKTGADPVSIDLVAGQIVLDSTVTAGSFRVAGNGRLVDNSTGTTVNKVGLVNNDSIAEAVWSALVSAYQTAGSFGQLVGRKLLTISKFIGLK